MANAPLHTTRTAALAARLQENFTRYSADRHINPIELNDLRAEIERLEGQARHADNVTRFAQAIQRDTNTVAYLDTLRLKAGVPGPEAA